MSLKSFLPVLFISLLVSCTYLPEEIEISNSIDVEETTDYITLQPNTVMPKNTGLFFYPGGLVDYHAYIPLLQRVAAEGYTVVILKVTGNLAIINGNKTQPYFDDFPNIERWAVAGHSLGGVKAGLDVEANPEDYVGLIFMGAFPFNLDLSNWSGTALSIYGENDLLLNKEDVEEGKSILPPALVIDNVSEIPTTGTLQQTIYHEIAGGNHSYFGDYGDQDGDGTATITRDEQQELVASFIVSLFQSNQW